MTAPQVAASSGRIARFGARLLIFAAFMAAVAVLLLWLAGVFAPKVPSTAERPAKPERVRTERVVPVRNVRRPLVEPAVGTIRAVHETTIGSKLLARVVEVDLKAGQQVETGDVLVRLDDTDLRAKRKQAEAAVVAAEAALSQAQGDAERYTKLLKSNAVSRQEYDRAQSAQRSAQAELHRAQEANNEVQAMLEWATIRSPMTGVVIDKKVDVGDMVTPGQTLATILNPKRMQLVATVRESLAQRLRVGQEIEVMIENLDTKCRGTISEIVPEAQSASRAFEVKVTGPCPEGVYSGMFARILIPLDDEEVLIVPRHAVRNVGQLELIDVVVDGKQSRRAIRTGRVFGDEVEVLSGLRGGEQIALPPAAPGESEVDHG